MTTQPSTKETNTQALAGKLPGAQFFKNLSIGRKLAIGFGILVMLTLLSGGVSYLSSSQAAAKINQAAAIRVPTALAASRAQAHLLQMLADVRGYLFLGDQKYREHYLQSARAFEDDLNELNELSPDLDLGELEATYDDWLQLPDQLFELRDDQLDREPAYRLLVITGTQHAAQVVLDLRTVIAMQGEITDPTAEDLERLQDMAQFQDSFMAMFSALRSYVTTRHRIYRGEYESNLTSNGYVWERLRDMRDDLDPNQQPLVDNIVTHRDAFLDLPEQIFDDLEGDRWREDLYIFKEQAIPLTNDMRDSLTDLVEEQQNLLRDDVETVQKDLNRTIWLILSSGIIALIFGLGAAYLARATIAGPVRRLTTVAEQIRAGDLKAQARIESEDEIGILAETFNNMTSQLRQTLTQVRKEKKRADDLLEVVIPIGVELTTEKDFDHLLEKMLLEAQSFCRADAGTLYLRTDDDQLEFVIVRNDTQSIAMGGTTGQEITFSPLPLQDQTATKASHSRIAAQVALSGISSNIPDHNRPSDIVKDYHITSLLTIPLKNSLDKMLGVLQLLNAADPETQQIIPFDQNLQQMMESFSSLAVAALEAYIREQSLKQEIQELRIEIDEAKKSKAVAEITESDYFQELQKRAKRLRSRSKPDEEK